MPSLRFYVLTSSDINTLIRQFDTLPKDQTTVVINTQDSDYEFEAIGYCERNKIEWMATDSDGTPATGKNAVLKIFLESEHDYMVHVDGDDIITPYGKNFYRAVVDTDAPDVICLYNQISFSRWDEGLLKILNARPDSRSEDFIYFPKKYVPKWRYESAKKPGSNKGVESKVRYYERHHPEVDADKRHHWAICAEELTDWCHRYNDRGNSLNRMVFFSRKAAELMDYDPAIVVGEDQVQYYKLKKLAFDGELDMRVHNERPRYTYLYMQDIQSTTRNDEVDYDWRELLLEQLNTIKPDMYPEKYQLPELIPPYYEVNK